MNHATFNNKINGTNGAKFSPKEAIQLRDKIVELGVDCSEVEAVDLDETLNALLKS